MSTVPAINTRRYHGLLVATTHPPVGRIVVLHQMLEKVILTSPPHDGTSPGSEQVLELSSLISRAGMGNGSTPRQGMACYAASKKACFAVGFTPGVRSASPVNFICTGRIRQPLCFTK
ncbi:MAG: hypothetical protein HC898_10375 [Phycisphaerales bacterium]|nr:hypothetical protein [Phycisphaerales bacterium]